MKLNRITLKSGQNKHINPICILIRIIDEELSNVRYAEYCLLLNLIVVSDKQITNLHEYTICF